MLCIEPHVLTLYIVIVTLYNNEPVCNYPLAPQIPKKRVMLCSKIEKLCREMYLV